MASVGTTAFLVHELSWTTTISSCVGGGAAGMLIYHPQRHAVIMRYTASARARKFGGLMVACFASGALSCADRPTAPLLEPVSHGASSALEGDVRPDTILNRYVVVLRDHVQSASAASAALVSELGGLRFYVYETALKGFAVANLPPGAVAALRRNPLVTLVEEDRVMQPLQTVQYFTSPADTGLYLLDRIDQRNLPINWQYSYVATGNGAHIYIIDSGVRGGHQEWGYSRIGTSAAFIKWSIDPSPTIDQLGHGTAVAGAAAGSRIGVAKEAVIHSVRIDDGGGGAYTSDIIAGIDWVAGNHSKPAVANLSYGQNHEGIATAISGLINRGVSFVTAAGNDIGADACNPSTRVASVITVGATVVSDYRASYSNIGACVDLFAPGGDEGGYYSGFGLLELASNADNSAYRWSRGTSFAAPVVAGVAALILQQNRTLAPSAVADILVQQATPNVVINAGAGSPNRLLYSLVDVPAPPPPNPTNPRINGPSSVQPGSFCLWTVTTGSAVQPVSYQWFVDNVLQAETSESFYYTAGSTSFVIEAVLIDANGSRWTDLHSVSVSSGAPACLI